MGSIYDFFGAVKAFSIFIHWSYFLRKWSIGVFLMIRSCLSAVAFIPGPSVKYYLIRKLFTFFLCDCYPFLFCSVSKIDICKGPGYTPLEKNTFKNNACLLTPFCVDISIYFNVFQSTICTCSKWTIETPKQ